MSDQPIVCMIRPTQREVDMDATLLTAWKALCQDLFPPFTAATLATNGDAVAQRRKSWFLR